MKAGKNSVRNSSEAKTIAAVQSDQWDRVSVVPSSRWSMEDAEEKLASTVIQCARGISNSIRTL